jgi:photosystem II stability/assembly factor-like uncharacterized protein
MKRFTSLLLGGLLAILLLPAFAVAQKSSVPPPRDIPGERVRYETSLTRNPATGKVPDNIRSRELTFSTTIPTRETQALRKGTPEKIQLLPWTPRGPSNVGGRTRAFAIDATNENNLIAGGVSGGMWRSIDGGQSWVRTTRLDQHITATCIVQDPRPGKTATWYYGTGEYRGNSANIQGDGIFKSTDNGMTWEPLASTVSGTPQTRDAFDVVWRVVVDPSRTDRDVVYAAVIGGVYRSEDGGTTWQQVLGPTSDNRQAAYTDLVITEQGVLYATLSGYPLSGNTAQVSGIYRSADGINWTNITPTGLTGRYSRVVAAVAPSDNKQVYFLADMSSTGGSIPTALYHYTYVSGDGSGSGGVWSNRTASVPVPEDFLVGFNSQGSYNMAVRVSPTDPDLVCIAGTNIYISTDGFVNPEQVNWIGGYNPNYNYSFEGWKDMMYPEHHSDIHDLAFLPSNPRVLFSAGDGGLHKTTNCLAPVVSWIPLNNGYLTTQFYTLAINHGVSGDQTIIGGLQDNHTYGSATPGTPWKWLAGGDGSYCAIPTDKSTYYVSAQQGYLCRADADADMNLTDSQYMSFGTSDEFFSFIAPFLLDPNSNDRLYMTTTRRVWRNDRISRNDYASAWRPVVAMGLTSDYVASIALSTQPANRLYYGTGMGRLFRVENALQSAGTSTEITGQNFPQGTLLCIAIDPTNADRVLAVFSNYEIRSLFYTDNGGTSWTDVSGNLEEFPDGSGAGPSCRWADIVYTPSGPLFLVGTSTGMYSTTALQGETTQWLQEGATSIGHSVVNMIRTRQSDGYIAVATHGSGVFTSNAIATTSVDNPRTPEAAYLEQNFPNPASSKTTVSFAVPGDMNVTLTLLDALGNVQQKPVDTRMTAGYHSVVIDTEKLASGQYYLHLQVGNYAQTRLMTVVH